MTLLGSPAATDCALRRPLQTRIGSEPQSGSLEPEDQVMPHALRRVRAQHAHNAARPVVRRRRPRPLRPPDPASTAVSAPWCARSTAPAPPTVCAACAPNRRLARAADVHSRSMLRADFFSHGAFSQRVRRFAPRRIGETIAMRSRCSARGFVRMWLNSAPHRAVLLSRGFRRVGVGRRRAASGPPRLPGDGGLRVAPLGRERDAGRGEPAATPRRGRGALASFAATAREGWRCESRARGRCGDEEPAAPASGTGRPRWARR